MGAAFGGGSSQTLFGSTGASTFLSKATTAAAIIFMVTSLGLAYLSSHRTGGESVVTGHRHPLRVRRHRVHRHRPPLATPPATGSGDAQPAKRRREITGYLYFFKCAEVVEFGRHAILRG